MRVIRYSQSSYLCGLILTISWVFCHAFPINRYSVEAVLFISHFPSNHIIIDDSDRWLASLHQWLLKFWGGIVVNIFFLDLGAVLALELWRLKFLFVPLSCRRAAFVTKKNFFGSVFKSLLAYVYCCVHFVQKWKIQCLVWSKMLSRLLCSTY